jgi:hypothetical protein
MGGDALFSRGRPKEVRFEEETFSPEGRRRRQRVGTKQLEAPPDRLGNFRTLVA